MSHARESARTVVRGLVIFFLVAGLLPLAAFAQDTYNRASEVELVLRENSRIKGLQLTMDIRFLNSNDEFLERIGTGIKGTITGGVSKNGQPVAGAKIILEAYRVPASSGGSVTRTGRQVATTGADGTFQLRLKNLVDADSRGDIQNGEVAALRIEATGKNGKKADRLFVRGDTELSGLIE